MGTQRNVTLLAVILFDVILCTCHAASIAVTPDVTARPKENLGDTSSRLSISSLLDFLDEHLYVPVFGAFSEQVICGLLCQVRRVVRICKLDVITEVKISCPFPAPVSETKASYHGNASLSHNGAQYQTVLNLRQLGYREGECADQQRIEYLK